MTVTMFLHQTSDDQWGRHDHDVLSRKGARRVVDAASQSMRSGGGVP